MVIQNKPYNNKYSIGVYVDRWGGGNGMPPHVFIGLKVEKTRLSQKQISLFKEMLKKYDGYENFIETTSQDELTRLLNDDMIKYEKNRQAWRNGKNNVEYNKKRGEFDEYFEFFRICQIDITSSFKNFISNNGMQMETYDEVEHCVEYYAKIHRETLLNTEGFFGFGPITHTSNH